MLKFKNLISIFIALTFIGGAQAAGTNLSFSRACDSSQDVITIGFGGDLLMHTPLRNQGERLGYQSLWSELVPLFKSLDLVYLNLETPVSDKHKTSNYPNFNTSPKILGDLVASGVDLVSTANNHSMDKGSSGADASIDNLKKSGLGYFGTKKSDGSGDWFYVTEVRGIRLAFVACSFSTNGMPDKFSQVLLCYKNGKSNPKLLNLVSDLSQRHIVIVTPHWGDEGTHQPGEMQKKLGKQLIESGAIAVVGTHPHVVQPWEKYKASNGNEGLIAYSTGNFVSAQPWFPKRVETFIVLGLSVAGDSVWINGVRYVPLIMQKNSKGLRAVRYAEKSSESKSAISLVSNYYGTERILKYSDDPITNFECR